MSGDVCKNSIKQGEAMTGGSDGIRLSDWLSLMYFFFFRILSFWSCIILWALYISFPQIENPHLWFQSSYFTISPKVGLRLVGVTLAAHKRLHLSLVAPVDSHFPVACLAIAVLKFNPHESGAKKVHKYKWHSARLARNRPLTVCLACPLLLIIYIWPDL